MDKIEEKSLTKIRKVGNYVIYDKVLEIEYFGETYLGYEIDKEGLREIRMISKDKMSNYYKTELQNEIEILTKLNSKNIKKIYGVAQTSSNYYLCMEYCKYGDLTDFLKMEKELTTELVLKITEDIFEGFRVLYNNNIIHGDINPDCLRVNENRTIKISGFHYSGTIEYVNKAIDELHKRESYGIPFYKSPQLLDMEPFSSKCDVFSVAVVLFNVCFNTHPHFPIKPPNSFKQLYDKIRENPHIEFPYKPSLSENYKNMIRGMLKFKESERLSWPEVFELFEKEILSKVGNGTEITETHVLSLPEMIKSYHPHELTFKKGTFQTWICNALLDKGICRRNHTKEPLSRSHSFYQCKTGCDFKLCDICSKFYNEKKSRVIHEIDYENSFPIICPDELNLFDDVWLKENFEDDLRLIGKGAFGKVFMGRRKGNKYFVAIKILETMEEEQHKNNLQELSFIEELKNCTNIMSYERSFVNDKMVSGKKIYQLFIEMELANSNLRKFILETKSYIDEALIIDFFGQILEGLIYAHNRKCSHLDLKPANILLVGDKVKIADWGGSIHLNSNTSTLVKSKEVGITHGWAAPEITCDYEASEKFNYYLCDVYSLGILIFNCCGIKEKDIKGLAKNKKAPHDLTIREFVEECLQRNYSKELLLLLEAMTNFNPKERPKLEKVIEIYQKLDKKV